MKSNEQPHSQHTCSAKELAQQGDKEWSHRWHTFLCKVTSLEGVPSLLRSMCGVVERAVSALPSTGQTSTETATKRLKAAHQEEHNKARVAMTKHGINLESTDVTVHPSTL